MLGFAACIGGCRVSDITKDELKRAKSPGINGVHEIVQVCCELGFACLLEISKKTRRERHVLKDWRKAVIVNTLGPG